MFLWNELRTDRTCSTEPILTYANVSSTKRLHFWTWSSNLGTKSILKFNHKYICYHKPQRWTHGSSINLDINLVVKWEVYVFSAQSSWLLYIRDGEKLSPTAYRKDTHNDLYLHWNSFTPVSWKRGTLKSLISRAYMVCSNETLLEKELKHLKHVFHKINGYAWWVIGQGSTSF